MVLKLYYVDYAFWRGERSRMILFMSGVEYEDVRVTMNELKAMDKSPFGSFPILELEDGKILSQTQAIAAYCGKLAKMYPEDAWDQAKVDELLNGCTDITELVVKNMKTQDAEEKMKARKEMVDKETPGRLYMYFNGLNSIVAANTESDYSVGTSLTVADLAIWRIVLWLDSSLDGVPKNWITTNFPALKALLNTVDAMPKVQEWKQKHSKFYS